MRNQRKDTCLIPFRFRESIDGYVFWESIVGYRYIVYRQAIMSGRSSEPKTRWNATNCSLLCQLYSMPDYHNHWRHIGPSSLVDFAIAGCSNRLLGYFFKAIPRDSLIFKSGQKFFRFLRCSERVPSTPPRHFCRATPQSQECPPKFKKEVINLASFRISARFYA